VEDLVRVRIADSAEQARIRERSFDGVILGSQPLRELLARRFEDFDSAAIEVE
jgi:hypothetical protein